MEEIYSDLYKRLENCKRKIALIENNRENGIGNGGRGVCGDGRGSGNRRRNHDDRRYRCRNRGLKSKLLFENTAFRCHLYCDQCSHIKINGQRCKNRVCFGTPVCWIHSKQLYGVKIKNSTIVGFEKGLFAVRPITTGEWICPMVGEQVSKECLHLRYPQSSAPYAFKSEQGVIFDSACTRGIGSMANNKFTGNGRIQPQIQDNAMVKFRSDMNSLWLQAIDDIVEGEEIFVSRWDDYVAPSSHITKRAKRVDNRPC